MGTKDYFKNGKCPLGRTAVLEFDGKPDRFPSLYGERLNCPEGLTGGKPGGELHLRFTVRWNRTFRCLPNACWLHVDVMNVCYRLLRSPTFALVPRR
jgi:hypothetical protein